MASAEAYGVLGSLQRGLEEVYRVATEVNVEDFVIDAKRRERMGLSRMPREQLLLAQDGGDLEVGLFIDENALANLERNDPTELLHDGNLGDFLLAIEGVSHFVKVAWRAQLEQPVSALELELQAEVDKYITCILGCREADAHSERLRRRLFEEFSYEPDLQPGERERYEVANENAARYAAHLERDFVQVAGGGARIGDMLAELRRFYRLSLGAKLDFIRQAS
jgi:hypothetical protein